MVGGSSGNEMVGIGEFEIEMEGMEGELQDSVSSMCIGGGSGTLMVGTIGAEAVDSGI